MRPHYFSSPLDFRAWLHEHHASRAEVFVGYYKKGSGRTTPGLADLAFGQGERIPEYRR